VPIYEYRCAACRRRFTVFFRSFSEVTEPTCAHCGAGGASKLPSRVRLLRSDEDRMESLADPSSLSDVNENDPRSVARWARRLGKEMGEDLGDEFDDAVDAMEAGESDGEATPGDMGGDTDGDDLD
jgi:putative FmdB family regulatory protein